jgi:hypothetical protein
MKSTNITVKEIILLAFTTFSGVSLILVCFLFQAISRGIGMFLVPLLFIFILVMVIISLVFGIRALIRNRHLNIRKTIPLYIVISSIIIAALLFNNNWVIHHDFYKYYPERSEIVEQILSGELMPDEKGYVELPEESQLLSDDGNVIVGTYMDKPAIVFYYEAGISISIAKGFLYLPDDNADFSRYRYASVKIDRDYGKGWYYCKEIEWWYHSEMT